MILLGAGASYGSKDSKDRDILMGEELSEVLCKELDIKYEPGFLQKVYGIAKQELGARLVRILEDRFKHTTPSLALDRLAMHVWPRIYTLNIDDATDKAFQKKSKQKVSIRATHDNWSEIDNLFSRLDLIKLNGCITRPTDGFIFSPSEYASTSNTPPEWYRQLGRDYLNYTFVFIGTKLDEPLFYQQIEYYKNTWTGSEGMPGRAYVITPSINDIDKKSLATSKIEHIPGTLEDFVKWLDSEINNSRSPMEVAATKAPELALISDDRFIANDLSKIIKINSMNKPPSDRHLGKTREFYLGFKPTWDEIFEEIPARLEFQSKLERAITINNRIHVVTGQAGSGKSTALMMLAAQLSKQGETVYYLQQPISNLTAAIKQLDQINKKDYYFFIDRASSVIDGIVNTLEDASITRAIIICGERLNVWKNRSEWALSSFHPNQIKTSEIMPQDASKILAKLEAFGPWSRVSKLSEARRKEELLEKSKRQLLIGLMELTYGYGFEQIIANDFERLSTEDAKLFVTLIGLATIHGLPLSRDICLAALSSLGIKTHIDKLLLETQGIVHQTGDSLRARHPIYIDKLFDGNTPLETKERAIRGLLSSMTRHPKPISRNMSRSEVMLFKYAINHNFMSNFFHGKTDIISTVFKDYEKHFELDGLFYLQYGLALRDMGKHDESLRKLHMAVNAWAMKQTEHAYAQQLLICAMQGSKENAYRNLETAKEILLRLDARHIEDDTDYPIVTLAEHHVKIVKQFDTTRTVTETTNHYIRELTNRQRRGRSNIRLQRAREELLRIASSTPENGRNRPKRNKFTRRSNPT